MSRNAAMHEPMAKANDKRAASDVILFFRSWRKPKMASARRASSQVMSRASRLASRWRKGEPKARCASSGSRPWATASSRWDCSSSSISSVSRLMRNRFVNLRKIDTSGLPEDAIHGGRHSSPPRFFHAQLILAGGGHFVDAGAPAILLGDPLGANPAGLFHAVESWIKGTFLHAEDVGRNVLNGGHDRVAVQAGTAGEDFEDQQVERALQGIGSPQHTQTSKYIDV